MEIPDIIYPDCDLLSQHLKRYFEIFEFKRKPEGMGLLELMNAEGHFINNGPILGIYADFEKTLNKYGFDTPKQKKAIIRELEKFAKFYISEFVLREQKKPFDKYLKIIAKMERLAAKFQSEINDAGTDFFEFLHLIDSQEPKDEDEPSVSEFFNSFQKNLRIFQSLNSRIPKTKYGKDAGIGRKAPKGKQALYKWVSMLAIVWAATGRHLREDKNKKIGRKQFLDFACESMYLLHLDVEAHSIDNAIRKFQKSEKGVEFLKLINST